MLSNKHRKLSKAPIVEAIIDIRLKPISTVECMVFQNIENDVSEEYTLDGKQQSIGGVIKFDKTGNKKISNTEEPITTGYIFKNKNNNTLFQARSEGFTFNMLSPYTEWIDFKSQAKKQWDRYIKHVQVDTIVRIAVRYVNKIPIKMPFEAEDYFLTFPKLSEQLDNHITTNLFSQITIHNKETNAFANITQGLETIEDNNCLFIFDIDSFLFEGITQENLWDKLDTLRDFKNEIFFNSITAKTLEIIE